MDGAGATIGIVDYGAGQPPLGREGARARRRARRAERRPRRAARRRRARAARRRRVPRRRWQLLRDGGLRRAAARARGGGRAVSASAWACSCCSTRSDEHDGADGPRPASPATVRRARGAGAEAPAHRLERGALDAAPRRCSTGCRTRRSSTTCTPTCRIPTTRRDVLGVSDYGDAVRERRRARQRLRRAVPPREVLGRTGCAAAPTSPRCARGRRA